MLIHIEGFFVVHVSCRFDALYVDVDFAQFFIVDCRLNRRKRESTKSRASPIIVLLF